MAEESIVSVLIENESRTKEEQHWTRKWCHSWQDMSHKEKEMSKECFERESEWSSFSWNSNVFLRLRNFLSFLNSKDAHQSKVWFIRFLSLKQGLVVNTSLAQRLSLHLIFLEVLDSFFLTRREKAFAILALVVDNTIDFCCGSESRGRYCNQIWVTKSKKQRTSRSLFSWLEYKGKDGVFLSPLPASFSQE